MQASQTPPSAQPGVVAVRLRSDMCGPRAQRAKVGWFAYRKRAVYPRVVTTLPMSQRTTRRRYLGALGATLTASLAGCSGVLGDGNTTNGSSTTTEVSSENATTASRPSPSPYTRVYRNTIDSIVLIGVTSRSGQGGQGSGFVFRDNYIVTNAHVVSNASTVQVRFSKGQWRSASVVGTDPSSDLAVIEAQDPPQYAEPLPLVEDPPVIGMKVAAIGSPYSLEGSITSGIISAVNRSIPAPNGRKIPDAIQTDAPVNPGNSGGPLLNLQGEVVGVVSSGGGENLAFAVSAALMKRVVPALIEDGDYDYAYIGIVPRTVTPSVAERVGLDQPRGVLVRSIRSGTPAAGTLRQGDIILAINGNQIDTKEQLASYLALKLSPGDTVDVTVLRNGERRTLSFTLGSRPEQPGAFERTSTPG
jgi:serine protease Do